MTKNRVATRDHGVCVVCRPGSIGLNDSAGKKHFPEDDQVGHRENG